MSGPRPPARAHTHVHTHTHSRADDDGDEEEREICRRLRKALDGADLETVTMEAVRKRRGGEMGGSLKHKKGYIKEVAARIISV